MDVQNLQCQPVVADPKYFHNSINIVVEAHLFQYQVDALPVHAGARLRPS